VAAQQQYDPNIGTPQVQWPAFAVVFRLRDPNAFTEVVEEAWQKWMGLMNVIRGQSAEPGLLIDRDTYGGTRYSLAYFSAKGEKNRSELDTRFNFRPALAVLGDYLILSSTDGLTRDLIDALNQELASPPKPLPQTHTLLEIDGAQAVALIEVNRKNLVRHNMLEKGITSEQADKEIGLLTAAMRFLDQASFSLATPHGQTTAGLKIKLNLP
jgi:hypothetical protein